MEDRHLAVAGDPNISFDGVTSLDGFLEGEAGILRHAFRDVMQPAMGDGGLGQPFGKIGAAHALGSVDQENGVGRSEEHTSELQSLMRISYAVFCLKKKNKHSDQN